MPLLGLGARRQDQVGPRSNPVWALRLYIVEVPQTPLPCGFAHEYGLRGLFRRVCGRDRKRPDRPPRGTPRGNPQDPLEVSRSGLLTSLRGCPHCATAVRRGPPRPLVRQRPSCHAWALAGRPLAALAGIAGAGVGVAALRRRSPECLLSASNSNGLRSSVVNDEVALINRIPHLWRDVAGREVRLPRPVVKHDRMHLIRNAVTWRAVVAKLHHDVQEARCGESRLPAVDEGLPESSTDQCLVSDHSHTGDIGLSHANVIQRRLELD